MELGGRGLEFGWRTSGFWEGQSYRMGLSGRGPGFGKDRDG